MFYVGCDLGQSVDFTAVCVLERIDPPTKKVKRLANVFQTALGPLEVFDVLPAEQVPVEWHLRHITRWRDVSYPVTVERVKSLVEPLDDAGGYVLGVDYTGVGRPVFDIMQQAGLAPTAITIHGGGAVLPTAAGYNVPKRDLISAAQIMLQNRSLKVSTKVKEASTLIDELKSYRVKIEDNGHDIYNPREGVHDDMVLALSIACWLGQRGIGHVSYVPNLFD